MEVAAKLQQFARAEAAEEGAGADTEEEEEEESPAGEHEVQQGRKESKMAVAEGGPEEMAPEAEPTLRDVFALVSS
ncbi:unnamed protein product [Ranitomeya imitator]|uniref:Uncharacterized protein n=1 Tax=Ranitomeya imitator TaxID=111125 RepID=A0ABN9LAS9_9NEOB|nr:unnamed protein product [Ranitomeya imitator]